MTYERAWYAAWGVAVLLGTCATVLVLPPASAFVGACVGALSAVLVDVVLHEDDERVPHGRSRGRVRQAVWGGATSVALLGLLVVAPALALVLLALAGLTSPPVVHRLRRRTAPLALAEDVRRDSGVGRGDAWPPSLHAVSDGVLCGLWTESYWMLRRCRSTDEGMRLVELRGRLLEEMARRRPAAVAEWLGGDAQPHQRPRAFGSPPPQDWTDEEGAA